MAGIMRDKWTEALKKDLYKYFWESYPGQAKVWPQLFEVVDSDSAYEQYTSAIGLGELLEKPEGEDLQTDKPMESYTIVCKNRSFGRVVRFSRESIDDFKKGNLVTSTVGSWSKKLPDTQESWYSKFFNRGAYSAGDDSTFDNSITGVVSDSSGDLIYDGKAFFATDHPDKVDNTYSNFSASRTLTAANLKTSYNTFVNDNNRDERGAFISLAPDTLVVNPALRFTAQEILNSTLIPSSMDNTTNVLNGIVDVIPWSNLSGSDDWILCKKGMGLMATQRLDPEIQTWKDEISKDLFVSIYVRWGAVVTNWRYWMAHNLPTS